MPSRLFILVMSLTGLSSFASADEAIFAQGSKTSSNRFVGNVYMNLLVAEDEQYTTKSGSVLFEAGGRTNWHYHPSGQILMVTAGTGYHQVEGQPKALIHKGDVIKVPANVKHWHGATEDTSMTHLFIIPNTEKGGSVWFEPVTASEFSE